MEEGGVTVSIPKGYYGTCMRCDKDMWADDPNVVEVFTPISIPNYPDIEGIRSYEHKGCRSDVDTR